MLCIEPFYRITLEMYINHPFFFNFKNIIKMKLNFQNLKLFVINIIQYLDDIIIDVKKIFVSFFILNIIHDIFPFYKIGMKSEEKKLSEDLINNIEENIKNFNKMKNDIKVIVTKIKNKYENNGIYNFEKGNDFHNYYIECLKIISENTFIENNIKLLDVSFSTSSIENKPFKINKSLKLVIFASSLVFKLKNITSII